MIILGNALLFYRTNATRQSLVPDPFNLPAAQKLEYTAPENFFEGIERIYQNKLIITPGPSNSGIRRTSLEDNGLKAIGYRIHGNFDKGTGDASVTKLMNFEGGGSVGIMIEEAFHVEGIFGIIAAATSVFDVDPTSTFGLGIDKTMLKHISPLNTIFDFAVDLVWGGTYTPPSV